MVSGLHVMDTSCLSSTDWLCAAHLSSLPFLSESPLTCGPRPSQQCIRQLSSYDCSCYNVKASSFVHRNFNFCNCTQCIDLICKGNLKIEFYMTIKICMLVACRNTQCGSKWWGEVSGQKIMINSIVFHCTCFPLDFSRAESHTHSSMI